jgi:hypothetical protein
MIVSDSDPPLNTLLRNFVSRASFAWVKITCVKRKMRYHALRNIKRVRRMVGDVSARFRMEEPDEEERVKHKNS